MTNLYIGTKEVMAWPSLGAASGADGYAVKYADGYSSWSPREAFCEAYRLAEGFAQCLTFGDALHFLKQGRKVTRTGWNGKGLWLEMQRPDAHSKMSLPYLFLSYPMPGPNGGDKVPWAPSQTDVLAEDWMVLPVGAV